MIAGHTHGGQFFPGTLVAAAIFPVAAVSGSGSFPHACVLATLLP